jgi:hypothetical protein
MVITSACPCRRHPAPSSAPDSGSYCSYAPSLCPCRGLCCAPAPAPGLLRFCRPDPCGLCLTCPGPGTGPSVGLARGGAHRRGRLVLPSPGRGAHCAAPCPRRRAGLWRGSPPPPFAPLDRSPPAPRALCPRRPCPCRSYCPHRDRAGAALHLHTTHTHTHTHTHTATTTRVSRFTHAFARRAA